MVIGPPKSPGAGVQTGMRRVSWIRITLDGDGGARCQLHGIGHRLPVTRQVALDTALALAASGVPTVVRSAEGHPQRLQPAH